MTPKKYDIALCGKGGIGLITSSQPQLIDFGKDFGVKDERLVWTGIYLTDHLRKPGSFWCSSNPQILGNLKDLPAFKDLKFLS